MYLTMRLSMRGHTDVSEPLVFRCVILKARSSTLSSGIIILRASLTVTKLGLRRSCSGTSLGTSTQPKGCGPFSDSRVSV